jgi:autotransporter-associated beta strand protein
LFGIPEIHMSRFAILGEDMNVLAHSRSTGFKTRRVIALAAVATVCGLTLEANAATFTRNNTVGADTWALGPNWSAVPLSASDTTLTFGAGSLAASAAITSDNDIAGNFLLNKLNVTYAGPGSGTQPTLTISGNPLEFVADGATNPELLFNGSGTVRPWTTISNTLRIAGDLTFTANSRAQLTGAVTMLNAAPRTLTFAGTQASGNNLSPRSLFDGAISDHSVGNATSIVKNGVGHWLFRGANDYTGTTTVNAGVLESSVAGNFGSGDITVASGGTIGLRGAGTYNNNISIIGIGKSINPSTVAVDPGAIWLNKDTDLAGVVTLTGDSRISAPNEGGSADTGTAIISGKITGPFGIQFGSGGNSRSHALRISNTGNDYTGNTTVLGGPNSTGAFTLQLGNSEVIPHGPGKGNVILNSQNSTTLNLNGFSETINALISSGGAVTGARTVTNSVATPVTLTVGAGDASGYYGYAITGGANLALTKIGSGTQGLGASMSYTGATTVSGGVLELDFNGSAGSATTAVANYISASSPLVLDGGTFRVIERADASEYSQSITTTTSTAITVADASGLRVGQPVTGTFIGSGKYISRISGSTIYLGGGAPTAGTDTVSFPTTVFTTTQNFASLTLNSDSTLDFGAAGDSTVIRFAAIGTIAPGAVLNIDNWSGIEDVGGGTERLLFTGEPDDFEAAFAQSQVNFIGFSSGYKLIDGDLVYEVIPIPEPTALAVLALGGLGLLARNRRRV